MRVGDSFRQDEGTWREKQWTVDTVETATIFIVRDVMENFEERFPNEPFFLGKIKLGSSSALQDLAPFIASTEGRRKHAEALLTLYQEKILPLGAIAGPLHQTIAETMQYLSTSPTSSAPLHVEWGDQVGQSASKATAGRASKVILTRSALETLSRLGLFVEASSSYKFIAPQSLVRELRRELAEAERREEAGHTVMSLEEGRFQIAELPPLHDLLKQRVARLRHQLKFLETALIEPRPLAAIRALRSAEESARDIIGGDSYDAVSLTKHTGHPLFADDLGLRKMLAGPDLSNSFSSLALLQVLEERGVINPETFDRHILSLVGLRYASVTPSLRLLDSSLRLWPSLPANTVESVFDLLASQIASLEVAAKLLCQGLKTLSTSPITFVTPESVVRIGLASLSKRWPLRLCARTVARLAESEFLLLPLLLSKVQKACRDSVQDAYSAQLVQ
jgi:hypothetical protein